MQELVAAQAALDEEKSRAGESGSALERQAAEHRELVQGLEAQLAAALKSGELAETAAKQHTYDLAATYRRADKAEAEARAARAELQAARDAAAAATAAAAAEATAAAETVSKALEERAQLEAQLRSAQQTRDSLLVQLGERVEGASTALPPAPTGVSVCVCVCVCVCAGARAK